MSDRDPDLSSLSSEAADTGASSVSSEAANVGTSSSANPVFEAIVSDGVCRVANPGARFLSTGFDGGRRSADAAYNVTVPEGFDDRDLRSYVVQRVDRAGFDDPVGPEAAPALLTGVDQSHARIARFGPVAVLATVGLSNPAALPVVDADRDAIASNTSSTSAVDTTPHHSGTVNLIAGTTRSLADGALANLLTVVAEAKATTLLALTGFPGTTSDAVIVADDPDGDPATFSGSATPVGRATRICVRDALIGSLRSRYAIDAADTAVADADAEAADAEAAGVGDAGMGESTDRIPIDVADAASGVVSDDRATVRSIEFQ